MQPNGVCGRVFQGLSIGDSAAVTLLSLAEVLKNAPTDERGGALRDMVAAHAKHLDSTLTFTTQGSKAPTLWQRSGADAAIASRAASLSGEAALGSDAGDAESPELSVATGDTAANPAADAARNSCASEGVPDDALDALNLGAVDDDTAAAVDAQVARQMEPEEFEFTREEVEKSEEAALRAALTSLQDSPEAVERIAAQNRHVTPAIFLPSALYPEEGSSEAGSLNGNACLARP